MKDIGGTGKDRFKYWADRPVIWRVLAVAMTAVFLTAGCAINDQAPAHSKDFGTPVKVSSKSRDTGIGEETQNRAFTTTGVPGREVNRLQRMWSTVRTDYDAGRYRQALAGIREIKKYASPPEVLAAEMKILDILENGKPAGLPLEIAASYKGAIYKNREEIVTEAKTITLDSVRMDLRDSGFPPGTEAEIRLTPANGTMSRVGKGTCEMDAASGGNETAAGAALVFKDKRLKIEGLREGINRLVFVTGNRQRGSVEDYLLIRRVPRSYKKIAVLTGVLDYPWDRRNWNREMVENDMNGLKDVLERQGYDPIILMPNPDIDQLQTLLRKIRAGKCPLYPGNEEITIGKADDLIFYFSGHGFRRKSFDKDDKEYGLIIPYNTAFDRQSNLPRLDQCLPMDDISAALEKCPARHKILALDTCYAGHAMYKGDQRVEPRKCEEEYFDEGVFYLMAASRKDEKSWAYENIRQSAFTRALTEALAGKAAGPGEECLTLFHIADYVTRSLKEQSPVFRFFNEENGMPEFEVLR